MTLQPRRLKHTSWHHQNNPYSFPKAQWMPTLQFQTILLIFFPLSPLWVVSLGGRPPPAWCLEQATSGVESQLDHLATEALKLGG